MAGGKPWADGPFKLLPISILGYEPYDHNITKPCHEMAEEMVTSHNLLLRGANCIYLQCDSVEASPQDVPDFVNFANVWVELVMQHHDCEEEIIFPDLEEKLGAKGLMADSSAQHALFHDGLEELGKYLQQVLAGEAQYRGQAVKETMDSFMPAMKAHLDDEITTLLRLEEYEDKLDWKKWQAEVVGKVQKAKFKPEMKYTAIALAIYLNDRTFEGGVLPKWPAMPWIGEIMFQWLFLPKHKNWWRFAACDSYGQPKELPFA